MQHDTQDNYIINTNTNTTTLNNTIFMVTTYTNTTIIQKQQHTQTRTQIYNLMHNVIH